MATILSSNRGENHLAGKDEVLTVSEYLRKRLNGWMVNMQFFIWRLLSRLTASLFLKKKTMCLVVARDTLQLGPGKGV